VHANVSDNDRRQAVHDTTYLKHEQHQVLVFAAGVGLRYQESVVILVEQLVGFFLALQHHVRLHLARRVVKHRGHHRLLLPHLAPLVRLFEAVLAQVEVMLPATVKLGASRNFVVAVIASIAVMRGFARKQTALVRGKFVSLGNRNLAVHEWHLVILVRQSLAESDGFKRVHPHLLVVLGIGGKMDFVAARTINGVETVRPVQSSGLPRVAGAAVHKNG